MRPNQQYVQHDWSPTLYAALLAGMAVFTIIAMGLVMMMIYRSCQAESPALAPYHPALDGATDDQPVALGDASEHAGPPRQMTPAA